MILTPHFFLFSMIYFILTFFMFFMDNFYLFWVLMELSTLVFMGMSYSVFKNSVSFLLIFFIIQAVSAFLLLVFYSLGLQLMMSLSMILKLSMFPFHFWFMSLVVMFPNIIFFISSTLYKLPSIMMINFFSVSFSLSTFILSSIFTLFLGGLMMIFSSDLRFILISSSVANNSWLFFSQFCNLFIFFTFWVVYSVLLMFILMEFSSFMTISNKIGSSNKLVLFFLLFSMSGLPPLPIFFFKMLVIFYLFHVLTLLHLMFVLVSTLILLVGYLKFCFTYLYSYYSVPFYFHL